MIDFCEKNNIDYHIKYGTQKKDNKQTERIFREVAKGKVLKFAVWILFIRAEMKK